MHSIIFASTSGYKQQQLSTLGLDYQAIDPDVVEIHDTTIPAKQLALRLAKTKAQSIASGHQGQWILGSDQVAKMSGGELLTKPGNAQRAVEQLIACSGKKVSFYSAIVLMRGKEVLEDCTQTDVYFRELDESEIKRYIQHDNPIDCAGSFKVESLGITLFKRIESSDPTALIGLPLISVTHLLRQAGIAIP